MNTNKIIQYLFIGGLVAIGNSVIMTIFDQNDAAIGWAIGVERLLLLLSENPIKKTPPHVYLVNRGEKAELEALYLARKLRLANFIVELDSSGSNFSKQFKRADRSSFTRLSSPAQPLGPDSTFSSELKLAPKCKPNWPNVDI